MYQSTTSICYFYTFQSSPTATAAVRVYKHNSTSIVFTEKWKVTVWPGVTLAPLIYCNPLVSDFVRENNLTWAARLQEKHIYTHHFTYCVFVVYFKAARRHKTTWLPGSRPIPFFPVCPGGSLRSAVGAGGHEPAPCSRPRPAPTRTLWQGAGGS